MGSTAAAALLRKLAHETLPATIEVEPELVVRESSGVPRGGKKSAKKD
jgi:DNA-binding LacI/PurR family transcriptional regulator